MPIRNSSVPKFGRMLCLIVSAQATCLVFSSISLSGFDVVLSVPVRKPNSTEKPAAIGHDKGAAPNCGMTNQPQSRTIAQARSSAHSGIQIRIVKASTHRPRLAEAGAFESLVRGEVELFIIPPDTRLAKKLLSGSSAVIETLLLDRYDAKTGRTKKGPPPTI